MNIYLTMPHPTLNFNPHFLQPPMWDRLQHKNSFINTKFPFPEKYKWSILRSRSCTIFRKKNVGRTDTGKLLNTTQNRLVKFHLDEFVLPRLFSSRTNNLAAISDPNCLIIPRDTLHPCTFPRSLFSIPARRTVRNDRTSYASLLTI